MPEVTFIVPVYNAEQTIGRCADSILAQQNISDYEVIFVNDGSSDSSRSILESYRRKDARVVVIDQNNAGVSAARNAALFAAKGDYIQFLDADDWIPDHSTAQMLHAAKENHADLVIGNFYRVDGPHISEKGSIKQNDPMTLEEFAEQMLESPADFYYGVLWNKLYKNSIIQKNEIRMDEDLNYCEDFIFNLEYYLHIHTVVPLQVPVYYYVKTPGSLVNQTSPATMAATKINVFTYYNKFYKNILDEKEYRRDRLAIVSYLIDAAKDQMAVPFMPGTQKLGTEKVPVYYESHLENPIVLGYYMRKLYLKYCNIVADKYDMKLEDIIVMDALRMGSDCSSASIADFTGLSSLTTSSSLRRLRSKKYVKQDTSADHTALVPGVQSEAIMQDLSFSYQSFCETFFKEIDTDKIREMKTIEKQLFANVRKSLVTNVQGKK